MKSFNKFAIALLCVMLLCVALAGCDDGETTTSGTQQDPSTAPTTGSTEPTTEPTVPDDGTRTLLLTTQGDLPLVGTNITVYSDAELTQRLTVLRSDEQGMVTFQGEPGSSYYAVVDSIFGYIVDSSYVLETPMTQIRLACDLVDPKHQRNLELGDIMYDLDCTDWNGNPYRLADAMEAGKASIILQISHVGDREAQVLSWFQTVYETYGDKLDVVLLCKPDGEYELKEKAAALGLTYPGVTVRQNSDWLCFAHVMVVDRYGMLVLMDYVAMADQPTIDGIVRYFTAENYQQRLFEDGTQLLDYLDSLQPTEQVTYTVKLVDDAGTPLEGIHLQLCYPRRSVMAVTDDQGVATWIVNKRDDYRVEVTNGNEILEAYIREDDGTFAPGSTEKTIVLRRRQMTTYTIHAVDTDGKPVPGVKLWQHDGVQSLVTDASGVAQWQDLERETPYYHDHREFVPQGYLYSHTEQNGTEYTLVFVKLYRYTVQIVDEAGKPKDWMTIRYCVGDYIGSDMTDIDGWVTFWAPEGDITLEVTELLSQYSKTFEIPFGQAETVLVWALETVEYRVWLVWADGTPAQYLTVELIRADGSSGGSDGSGSEGYASFQALPREWTIYVCGESWQDGQLVMVEYGVFDFPEGETEVTIVLNTQEP